MLLPAITQWERPQPAMHVPYLDPHIATSSFPVHVSYTNGQCIHVHDGGWGVGCGGKENIKHAYACNCILNGTLVYTHIPHIIYAYPIYRDHHIIYIRIPYLQRPSYYMHIPYLQRPSYYIRIPYSYLQRPSYYIRIPYSYLQRPSYYIHNTISKQYILHKMSLINTHLINNYDTNVPTDVKGLKR